MGQIEKLVGSGGDGVDKVGAVTGGGGGRYRRGWVSY